MTYEFPAGAGRCADAQTGNRKNRPGDRPDGVYVVWVDGGGGGVGGGEGITTRPSIFLPPKGRTGFPGANSGLHPTIQDKR